MADRKRKLDVFQTEPPAQNGVATANPYTGRPYSQKYYDILAKRKGARGTTPCADFLCFVGRHCGPRGAGLSCMLEHTNQCGFVKGFYGGCACCRRAASVAGTG